MGWVDPSTLYVHRPLVNGANIVAWAKGQGFPTTLPEDDLHVTVAFSRAPLLWPAAELDQLLVPVGADRTVVAFDGGAVVLRFASAELARRWAEFRALGASWDHPDYQPHITISFDASGVDLEKVAPYQGSILLGPERMDEVKEDWKDNVMEKLGARHSKKDLDMLQQMHDNSVELGATCPGEKGEIEKVRISDLRKDKAPESEIGSYRIAKVDDTLGMVFGYSIICKINDEPYYDLNIDLSGPHKGERLPEHIPESTMLKAATEFMQSPRVGNEMHNGPDVGTYVFAFPLTTDIAKAMGISTNVTGLMIGFKPPPELLAKFKDGSLKGFSIEGRRISYQEHE